MYQVQSYNKHCLQHVNNIFFDSFQILALQSIFNTDEFEKVKTLSEVSEDKDGLFTLLVRQCNPFSKTSQTEKSISPFL